MINSYNIRANNMYFNKKIHDFQDIFFAIQSAYQLTKLFSLDPDIQNKTKPFMTFILYNVLF